jgi:hypothetical protein
MNMMNTNDEVELLKMMVVDYELESKNKLRNIFSAI